MSSPVGTREQWLKERVALLQKEKELTHAREEVASLRRALPRVPVEKEYRFDTDRGPRTLADLFDGRSQLIVYHFMFGPQDDAGCLHCSFWADSYDHSPAHLAQRDITFVLASRTALAEIQKYKARMGWDLEWVSSAPSDFNYDFGVAFTPEQQATSATYNYAPMEHPLPDREGLSVFCRDETGAVFHTYSTFARGIDPLNVAYQLIDLTPNGRGEAPPASPQDWVRRHDEYD